VPTKEPKPQVEEKGNLAEPCEESSENHPPSDHRIVLASASILGRFLLGKFREAKQRASKRTKTVVKEKGILAEPCEKSSGITRLLITGSC
jgi:hypothetical protein